MNGTMLFSMCSDKYSVPIVKTLSFPNPFYTMVQSRLCRVTCDALRLDRFVITGEDILLKGRKHTHTHCADELLSRVLCRG